MPSREDALPASLAGVGRARAHGDEHTTLDAGWEAAPAVPDAHVEPSTIDALDWLAARVPGTVAAALQDAGRWGAGEPSALDDADWWFRTRFVAVPPAPGEEVVLALDGIATVAEVFLNGERVLESDSMFAAHEIDVGARLRSENELAIRCRALTPLLRARRRPRARWRTRLVAEGNLRFFRTMLLGRAPGFAPGPAAVGPWRPVRLMRRRGAAVNGLALVPRLDGDDGVLGVRANVLPAVGSPAAGAAPISAEVELSGPSGRHRAALEVEPAGDGVVSLRGELRVPGVARWWPHTHGDPALHEVVVHIRDAAERTTTVDAGRTGFRALGAGAGPAHDVEVDGLDLHVNGTRVFARGAIWTSVDAVGLAPADAALRAALEQARDAGMNMLRVVGTGAYESPGFFDLCDELGLLVWQDFMFANLDYPLADPAFRATVEREAAQVAATLTGRPSVAVACGNSEIEQQVAMLGLAPELGRGELFDTLIPDALARASVDAIWVRSAPSGGVLPFRFATGVANYFGVGGYRRPLDDARRAEVRFASECLAFANVPDEAGVDALLPDAVPGDVVVHHPRWKAGVARDAGTGWDFDDVRDHYLAELFGLDPGELRRFDHARYLDLSRVVTGELMAEVFGEWRRAASPCGGGLVLWLRDLAPGAGWGVVEASGTPKAAYGYLRRALAPVAVWTSDEGLGGVAVHVANDRPEPMRARLRVAFYRDLEHRAEEASETVDLAPHTALTRDAEALVGRFVDAAWAYRFGPPAHDVLVASLERASGDGLPELLAQAFRFPAGRPQARRPADELGLEATVEALPGGGARLVVRSRRLAYAVRPVAPGFAASDDAFSVEPGGERVILLRRLHEDARPARVAVTALNLDGRVRANPV